MKKKNSVFIATSLDGYIADKNSSIAWLQSIPNPENTDMGYVRFMKGIDALLMGRKTFETVCGFEVEWPYTKPVFVWSRSLNKIPQSHKGKAYLVKGELTEILNRIHQQGYGRLYIDGGTVIQSFLKEDRIDEMQITTVPIVLGGGIPLFSELTQALQFELIGSEVFLNELVQSHYRRKR